VIIQNKSFYALNRLWLLSDDKTVALDHFMHSTLPYMVF